MKIFVTILIIAFLSLLTFNLVNFYLDQEISSHEYWRLGVWTRDCPALKEIVQSKYDDDNKVSNREYFDIKTKQRELNMDTNKDFLKGK